MTTSSARKAAAAEKASGTYRKIARRKTARKVGAGQAHSRDRKTDSKVVAEKARGTYPEDRRSIRGIRPRCANARVGARSRREERSSDA